MYKCGLLTISDSCFYQKSENVSGEILFGELKRFDRFHISATIIVPDEVDKIEKCLRNWSDEMELDLIITNGGTGFTPRDVTPEATLKVIDKQASSISQMLLLKSLEKTNFAVLSRGVSGIRKSTLIINFPGSPKAVKEYMGFLLPILPHALDQIGNKEQIVKKMHLGMQNRLLTKVSTMASDVAERERCSQFPLFSVEKALETILSKLVILKSVEVDITDSLNMVTFNTVKSKVNVPPFRASIKDGYAVMFSDKAGKRQVISVAYAGNEALETIITNGTCSRISTGAKVPEGADSVVQVEDTVLITKNMENGDEKEINIVVPPSEIGQDIRPIGNDLKVGELIVDKNTVIGPTEIGILAMGGISRVDCYRKPIVGVLSTGNELVNHTNNDVHEEIIDCNRPLLLSMFKSYNFNVVDLGIVKDDPQIILDKLLYAFQSCDVLVTTGGVSMGEKDYLKSVICQDLNAEIHFGRIFMKPGKPMTFSTAYGNYTNNQLKLIFSLPGNPVSAFVTSFLFVIPALKKISGHENFDSVGVQGKLMHDIKLDSRPEYRRCRIKSKQLPDGGILYEISCKEFGNQMSSRLASCLTADGLICLPPSSDICRSLTSGAIVTVLKF